MNKKFIVRGDIPKEPALTIKNQLLLSPGQWKGQKITKDAILKGLNNTNWSDRKSRDVIYGHRTNNETTYFGDPSPDIWVGYHTEPKYLTLSDGVDYEGMYADIHIFDQDLASKIAYGGAKAGISEGMEYDYYSGEIKKFLNSSVVNNPACKLAYLNLSEDSQNLGVAEPRFLNLADEEKKDEEEDKEDTKVEDTKENESKLNLSDYTDERRSNDVMEKQLDEMDKRLKAMETKFLNLSNEQSEEESKEKSEDKPEESDEKEETSKETEAKAEESKEAPKKEEPVKEKPKPKPVSEEQEEKPKEEVSKETESKGESKAVVLEKEKSQESDDKVVKAVEKMGEKIAEEFKKAAKPQTSAPTNPDASMSNVDEEVAQKLVEKYKQLHPTN